MIGLSFTVPLIWAEFSWAILLPVLASLAFALPLWLFVPNLRPHTFPLLATRFMLSAAAAMGAYVWLSEYVSMGTALVVAALSSALPIIGIVRTMFVSDISGPVYNYPRRDAAQEIVRRGASGRRPRITIHVPCCNEPPDLVLQTLRALARLDYDNYDVLVIDNNTKDPAVWMPLRDGCESLGPLFRFIHVENLEGAKAGALNHALLHTPPETELIALVDADYKADRDFLRYVPLFEDPEVGFVQTSHDYRDWEGTRFLRGAYYSYVSFHKVSLPIYNEFRAGFTVGTMCLLRRKALVEAGGWSEECLTEDSEVSIRMHKAGYVGHVFADTVGRGLIPENIESLKRQQFRWTAGPVQQLQLHWRALLGISKGKMSLAQQVLELHHCLTRLGYSFANVAYTIVLLILSVHSIGQPAFPIPFWVPMILVSSIISSLIDGAVTVRLSGGSGWRDQAYGMLISSAIEWTHIVASFSPLLGLKLQWKRTPKDADRPSFMRALRATSTETVLGSAFIALGVLVAASADHVGANQHTLLGFFLIVRGIILLSTLFAGLVAEMDLRKREGREAGDVRPSTKAPLHLERTKMDA